MGNEDKITPYEKVNNVYQLYKGKPKRFMIVDGEHHSERDNLELNFAVSFVESNISNTYFFR